MSRRRLRGMVAALLAAATLAGCGTLGVDAAAPSLHGRVVVEDSIGL